eukprot:IDg12907t1
MCPVVEYYEAEAPESPKWHFSGDLMRRFELNCTIRAFKQDARKRIDARRWRHELDIVFPGLFSECEVIQQSGFQAARYPRCQEGIGEMRVPYGAAKHALWSDLVLHVISCVPPHMVVTSVASEVCHLLFWRPWGLSV